MNFKNNKVIRSINDTNILIDIYENMIVAMAKAIHSYDDRLTVDELINFYVDVATFIHEEDNK